MKVLYISNAVGADYECDMIFHGMRSLLGADCVDINYIHFMYQSTPFPPFFSIYGLLPNIEVDRSDILGKIQNHFFDAVVYGSIQRCRDFFHEVRSVYPPNKVAFIDGEDDNVILHEVRPHGLYFKRELEYNDADLLPIQFCIPREKILVMPVEKTRVISPLDPRDRSTYIYYDSEANYYKQYAESYFGRTMKKGGWDCCRHYEIMAAGCVPYFMGIEHCPPRTLGWLPKSDLVRAGMMYESWPSEQAQYEDLAARIRTTLLNELTTEAMARRVLERIS